MEVSSVSETEASIFNSIVRRRRSIYPRQYIPGKKIPDEIIWQILENANRVPPLAQACPTDNKAKQLFEVR